MPELAIHRREKLASVARGIDTAICVAIFIAASMPAIVVMLLIAFPLLPLFGVWVSWVASTGGPTQTAESTDHRADDTTHVDHPGDHTAPTPRYA
jgi:hypothetical protein